MNQQYTESFTENFNVRLNVEPIKHFKIELTANRSTSRNEQSFFRYDEFSEKLGLSVENLHRELYCNSTYGTLRLSMMMKSTIRYMAATLE